MGKVIDQVFDIYITEETNCSATMYKSILNSRGIEVSDDALMIFSGYSGGVSTENLCGAVIGAVAAFGYLINKGDDDTFELSKDATEKFYNRVAEKFGSTNCHDIKTVYRTEEMRCLEAVKIIADIAEEVLQEFKD